MTNMKLMAIQHIVLISICLIQSVKPGAVQLNSEVMDQILANNELVFVNFYANWCRFSQMLEPIYDDLADKVSKELSGSKIAVAKADCDSEPKIAQSNQINKYPTLKLFRYGAPVKKEYRGARNADAFLNYLKEELKNPLKKVTDSYQVHPILAETKKKAIIGHFNTEDSDQFKTFSKLASVMRDSAIFIAVVNEHNADEHVAFRDAGTFENEEIKFDGDMKNYDLLHTWSGERCTSLVREITFENAEELTEEGLPFLILFHRMEDLESVRKFKEEVKRQLPSFKGTINAVHADGLKFSHPLNHLGKSIADLPLLAIDSFRHMYLYPEFRAMSEGQNLMQFVADLHSGKLHREFHNGPDPTTAAPIASKSAIDHLPKLTDNNGDTVKQSTPPESVFIKLAPSSQRYSLKDEGEL